MPKFKIDWLAYALSACLLIALALQPHTHSLGASRVVVMGGGLVALGFCLVGWWRSRAHKLYLAEALFLHIMVFMTANTLEEALWAWKYWAGASYFLVEPYTQVLNIVEGATAMSLVIFGFLWSKGVSISRLWSLLRWWWAGALFAAFMVLALL